MSRAADERATAGGPQRGSPLARLRACLRGRPDSEHELTINRLAVLGLVSVYLVVAGALGASHGWEVLRTHGVYFAIYCAISVSFFVHILYRPAASPARRIIGILIDFATLSWVMHVGGQITSLLYPMYLWVIFGNGFRFGLPYLLAAMVVGVTGFAVVIETTEYWWSHLELAAGLLTGLIILPLYAATLIRKLSAARQQAEAASQAKSQFLASVSHELRTPLNAIIGLSDLLRDARMDDEHREMTRTIGTASRSLLALINSLLDFSRIEQRCIVSNPVAFDLHAFLADVRAIVAVPAQEKSVRVALHVTVRTPRFVKADKRHLEEILLNLGGNAVKFTERGSVVIAVDGAPDGEHIRLRCEVSDTGIGIAPEAQARIFDSFTQADETIIDRFGGTGLGLAIVKQLVQFHDGVIGVDSEPGVGSTFWFELDVAAAQETTQMAACGGPVVLLSPDRRLHELATTAGADVTVATTGEEARDALAELTRRGVRRPVVVIDAGRRGAEAAPTAKALVGHRCADAPAIVLVSDDYASGLLPRDLRCLFVTSLVRPADSQALAAALAIACGNGPPASADDGCRAAEPRTRKLRVLVAEDNRTNQMVIAKILQRAGHEVHLVDNGEAALDALDERMIDIVLMDVNMPVMNGIEATRLYRFASPDTDQIPIVALTADATPEAEARCAAAGMNACLTKPVEAARILQVIESLTQHRACKSETARSGTETATTVPQEPNVPPKPEGSVDRQTLEDLREVGGQAFVTELVAQFTADAAAILRDLGAAATERNAEVFRDRMHALRSAAANIGAHRIYDLCLAWRQIGAPELASSGAGHVMKLREEIARAAEALEAYVTALEAAAPRQDVATGEREAG
jgi:two-component system, sensor histidine kinase RpfC